MEEEDAHLCLRCMSKISGLENYISHRKGGCSRSQTKGLENKNTEYCIAVTEDTVVQNESPVVDHAAAVDIKKIKKESKTQDRTLKVKKVVSAPKITYVEKNTKQGKGRPKRKTVTQKDVKVKVVKEETKADQTEKFRSLRRRKRVSHEESTSTKGKGSNEEASESNKASIDRNDSDLKRKRPRITLKLNSLNLKKVSIVAPPSKPKRERKEATSKTLTPVSNSEIYHCDLCQFQTKSVKSLKLHKASWSHLEKKAEEDGEERSFNCQECPCSFFTSKALRTHSREHISSFKCQECLENFPRMSLMKKHLTETGHISKFPCAICNMEFTVESHLRNHMTVHSDEKPHKCHICEFQTKRRADLSMHIKRHMGIKPFHCETCKFKCLKKSVLVRHMETHKDRPRDLICEVCGAAYCSKMVLQHHIFTKHQNGRRFPCNYEGCTYIFCYKSELIAHQRSHTKEKPYLCSVCGYEGSNTYALTKHMRIHTNEKPFKCPFASCSYASRFSAHLVRHKRLHTGEKPYKCPFCNYRCNAQENLRKHVRNTKKHSGRDMYICKNCPDYYTTNIYKEMVHHTRTNHSKEYIKLQDVSKQCGIFVPGYTPPPDIVEQAYTESQGMDGEELKIVQSDDEGAKKNLKTKIEKNEISVVSDPNTVTFILNSEEKTSKGSSEQPSHFQLPKGYQIQQSVSHPTEMVMMEMYNTGRTSVQETNVGGTITNSLTAQSVAEAMRCLVQGQGFDDGRPPFAYVVTNTIMPKDGVSPAQGQLTAPVPQVVSIQSADASGRPVQITYNNLTTNQSMYIPGQPTPIVTIPASMVPPSSGAETLHTMQVGQSTYSMPVTASSCPTTIYSPSIREGLSIITSAAAIEASSSSQPKESFDRNQQLQFSQNLVEAVNQARATSGDTAAVVLLQNMDEKADAILKQKEKS